MNYQNNLPQMLTAIFQVCAARVTANKRCPSCETRRDKEVVKRKEEEGWIIFKTKTLRVRTIPPSCLTTGWGSSTHLER